MTADNETPGLAYPWFVDWVEDWFFPQYTRRIAAANREGTFTWCRQWWRHREVAVRLAALWQAWEAARIAPDSSAMSAWWLMHADPHMRALTEAANGPMWRCTPQHHEQATTLPVDPVPPGYFPKPPEQPTTDQNSSGTGVSSNAAPNGGRTNTDRDISTELDEGLDL